MVGASVTCSSDSYSETKIAQENAIAAFTVNRIGEYLIVVTDGLRQRSLTVSITTNAEVKNAAITFGALNTHTPEEIGVIANSGKASEYFSIGEDIDIELSGIGTMTFQIADFNHDYLEAGITENRAPITFISKNLLYQEYQMDSSGTDTGGFPATEFYQTLSTTIYDSFPAEWKELMRTIYKWYTIGGGSEEGNWFGSKLFVPLEGDVQNQTTIINGPSTERTVGGTYVYPLYDAPPFYNLVDEKVPPVPERIKSLSNGTGTANTWWTATTAYAQWHGFSTINQNGTVSAGGASSDHYNGICFGFCV